MAITQDKAVKKEIARLKKIFKTMPQDKAGLVSSLIGNAAFMSVTLGILQETINREGVISTYQNGENQWGTKKSPEVEVYNTMIKNYMSAVKQLCDLLPEGGSAKADELMNFVKRAGQKK